MIAVVDDDPSILRALDRFIRSRGFLCKAFASAADFIDSLRAAAVPDCLILDVQMPGMSGFDLQSRLTQLGCKIPVIFITAHEDSAAEAQASQAGAAGFFYKPFKNDALWTAVLNALGSPPA
jgi:FixJ family two-component response regulator